MFKIYHNSRHTRSGATSLYVVVFASLLFTVIAVGFVSVIMSEVAQTVNDELSQSAYDSSLAGIEDAKLAIMKCRSAGAPANCNAINSEVGDADNKRGCNTVASILGRTITETGVLINEVGHVTAASAETLQSYTCVTIKSNLPDYRSYLSSTDTDVLRIVPIRTANPANVTGVRISWYASSDNNDYIYRNIDNSGRVSFAPVGDGISAPPTLSVQLIQTDQKFSLKSGELDYTVGDHTDRGTLFLVPTNKNFANVVTNNHIANTGTTSSQVGPTVNPSQPTSTGFVKANDKAQTNYPYIIRCETEVGSEFACSATIELPQPVSTGGGAAAGTRSGSTSMLVISMPYDQPSTDFAVELCTDDGTAADPDRTPGTCDTTANFEGAQYSIDSTGRANDVYNRVEARVELADIYFPYPVHAVQLTGGGDTFVKKFWVANNDYCVYTNNSRSFQYCTYRSGYLNNH